MRKNLRWTKRIIIMAAICFIAGGWSLLFYHEQQGISVALQHGDYVRLHILANSDTLQDQQLKLKVRDAVVAYLTPFVKEVKDAQEANTIIASRREEIIAVAKNTLAENGAEYPVTVQMGNFEFPERSYGKLVLPAGEYQAVRILLGQAAGQNWWCVLFPPLCFIDGAGTALAPVAAVQDNTQQESNKTPEIRWKIAEIFNL